MNRISTPVIVAGILVLLALFIVSLTTPTPRSETRPAIANIDTTKWEIRGVAAGVDHANDSLSWLIQKVIYLEAQVDSCRQGL